MSDSKPVSQICVVSSCILGLFLSIECSIVCAQSYNFEVQTIPLKGEFINFSGRCFMQDSEGFMWLGSSEGLYRYHGTGVKVYRHIPDNENSLSDNFIMDLYEDSEGVIWIGTKNGLNRFDKYTETFKWYGNREGDSTSITWGEINKIAEDREGNLWIANDGGFNRFDRGTETFENYRILRDPEAAIKDPYQIFNLIPDKEYLWLSAGDGLHRYNVPSGNMEQIKEADSAFVWDVFIDRSGRYWLPCFRGLLLLDTREFTYKPFPNRPDNPKKITNQHVRTMLEDGSGNIWLRTWDGIYCYNQALELKYYLEHSTPLEPGYGGQEMLKEMFIDNTGAIWYYSADGINQIRNIGRNFRSYSSAREVVTWVKCICLESKNLVWFGTLQGINSLDRSKDFYKLHYGHPVWLQGFPYSVNTMFSDSEGTLWIGMRTDGLLSMGRSDKGEVSFRKHWPVNVDSSRVREYGLYGINSLFEDSRGRLWVGSWSEFALQYYDRAENRMIRLVNNPSSTDRLPEKANMRLQTGLDTLWAMGSSGIFKIIQPLRRISDNEVVPADVIQCRLVGDDGESIDLHSVTFTYMDGLGDLWVGSGGGGLFRIMGKRSPGLDDHEYRVTNYTTLQGLPGNQVLSILPDGKGNLWMGTNNGLTKFNLVSETFTNYDVRHGLPVNEFMHRSSATGKDGEMFFGTLAGMISFYPDSIFTNQNVPPVRLTDIKINNELLQPGYHTELEKAITFTNDIELNYNQDNLSIEYAILNFDNPELNQYRYILEGFNDDWVYAGNRTNAEFTNLDPGRYTFRVLGSNNDGIWNEEGTSLQITIAPPPWQTWYAYIIYGLVVSGILLWYRRYQRNRANLRMAVEVEKIEKEKIQEIDHMKSRFFANISHEFRTPLTLILGPLEEADKRETKKIAFQKDVVAVMRRNAGRLLRLINQLLDVSKLETGKLKLQVSEGDFEGFFRTLVLSFLSLAESRGIKYTHNLPHSSRNLYFDPDKFEKILTNLISNAFKFTSEGGEVGVRLEYVDADQDMIVSGASGYAVFAEIKISDTGKGIPANKLALIFDRFYQVTDSDTREEEGTGIGLALTRELVDLYRGEIHVESEVGRGTLFTVRLPVSRELFNEEEIVDQEKDSAGKSIPGGQDFQQKVLNGTRAGKVPEHRVDVPSVLIVEDNTDLINYISGILGDNYRILMSGNGKTGLQTAIDNIPDLIISDIMMPEMDGIEMCRKVKEDERTSHIPVILLTARAYRDSKLKGLETGADDYLIKPFDTEELAVRVRNLIDQRQKLRDKFRKELITEPEGTPVISPEDRLLSKVMEMCNQHLSDSDFNIEGMSGSMNMSRTQLYRKIHAITGHTPKELLQTIRLKKAASLLESGERNVSQVAYQVGFNNLSYFAKSFRRLYKVNPSEHLKRRN